MCYKGFRPASAAARVLGLQPLIPLRHHQISRATAVITDHHRPSQSFKWRLQEVRSMLRARKSGVLTPVIYSVEHEAATIYMERIVGASVRDLLLSGKLKSNGDHNLFFICAVL